MYVGGGEGGRMPVTACMPVVYTSFPFLLMCFSLYTVLTVPSTGKVWIEKKM